MRFGLMDGSDDVWRRANEEALSKRLGANWRSRWHQSLIVAGRLRIVSDVLDAELPVSDGTMWVTPIALGV